MYLHISQKSSTFATLKVRVLQKIKNISATMHKRCLHIPIIVILIMSVGIHIHASSYALLVGISHYSADSNTGWEDINGVNDIRLLKTVLQQQGFVIDTLTETDATALNIRNAMRKLMAGVKTNDTVYLHFSGHGQPVEDTDNDEQDGWDESFVPFDAGMWYKQGIYEGKNHITDDEFNSYFGGIRHKIGERGLLLVIIDACHSGTMSRMGTDSPLDVDAPVRGTYIGFSREKIYHPVREGKVAHHFAIQADKKLSPVVIIEACQAWQQNTEVLIDRTYYGPLSYTMHTVLKNTSVGRIAYNPNIVEEAIQHILPSWSRQQIVIETSIR